MAKKMKANKKPSTAKADPNQQLRMIGGVLVLAVVLIIGVIVVGQIAAGDPVTIDENETYRGVPIGGQHAGAREVELASDVAAGVERGVNEDGIPYFGDPNAAIQIADFSDFSCPACGQYHDTFVELLRDFGRSGDAVFYYFPLDAASRAPQSTDASRAALCAAEQGGFWEMHDEIFRVQLAESLGRFTPEGLEDMADDIGLDGSEVRACMSTNAPDAGMVRTDQVAREYGVSATPTLLYRLRGQESWQTMPTNDGQISGGRSYDFMANLIRQANDTES
ncbi:MAG: DsbA family protein [Anaerolineales bacterium]